MIALILALLAEGATADAIHVEARVSQTLIIRTRAAHGAPKPPPAPPPAYREKRGPVCIEAAAIAGAAVTAPDAVDFILKGGQRLRARLEAECPALDYYRGFYVSPNPDGRICADRDAIRTRSGGECQIDRFRKLEPVTPR
ncbi:MAG TPA: hypothetical protein VGC10_04260 [Sphingomonas sp.]